MIKIISFDLDGTIIKKGLEKEIWNSKIPKIFANQYDLSYGEARKKVLNEYWKLDIKTDVKFSKPSFWLKYFKLNFPLEELLNSLRENVEIFEDSVEILDKLKKKYKLAIFSSSPKELLNFKLSVNNLESYFIYIISTIDDFHLPQKNAEAYIKLLDLLKIRENEIVHIGDDPEFDRDVPKTLGIKAFYLDRSGEKITPNTISSLNEIDTQLKPT